VHMSSNIELRMLAEKYQHLKMLGYRPPHESTHSESGFIIPLANVVIPKTAVMRVLCNVLAVVVWFQPHRRSVHVAAAWDFGSLREFCTHLASAIKQRSTSNEEDSANSEWLRFVRSYQPLLSFLTNCTPITSFDPGGHWMMHSQDVVGLRDLSLVGYRVVIGQIQELDLSQIALLKKLRLLVAKTPMSLNFINLRGRPTGHHLQSAERMKDIWFEYQMRDQTARHDRSHKFIKKSDLVRQTASAKKVSVRSVYRAIAQMRPRQNKGF